MKYINVDLLKFELDKLEETEELYKVLEAIKKVPEVDAVELDRDYWEKYYDVNRKSWHIVDNGDPVGNTFSISYKKGVDDEED